MTAFSIKRYLPRSLNGRVALILLLPIMTLQMVVSIAFVQRYYEGISEQMTRNLFSEIDFFIRTAEQANSIDAAQSDLAALSGNLDLSSRISPDRVISQRNAFDLAGRAIEATLTSRYPTLQGVDFLADEDNIQFSIGTRVGNLAFSVPKHRFAAPNRHQLLVVTFFTGLLMAIISLQFLRIQMRPIRRLARAAEAFGKGQNVPYQVRGASEVRAAGRAFLNMRNRIERQKEQRTLMLSGVSHDLRTPLTRLKLSLSLLGSQEDAEAAIADVNEMERLITSFLDFARSDTAEQSELVDVGELVGEIVHKAGQNKLPVTLGDMPPDQVYAEIRPHSIERALSNLVGNAVRYADNARVSLHCDDKTLRLIVEDDGPGIPPQDRDQAMEPFARLDPARNQNKGSGVGLGLAIVNDIARSHGGRLVLEDSKNLGGLRAEIVIPL